MGCCGETQRVNAARVNGKVLSPPDIDLNGLEQKRRCTDIGFLILFIAFCIGGIFYLAVSFNKGDMNRLLHGTDPYGNVCGQKNPKYFNLTESGKDMTLMPFLDIDHVSLTSGLNPAALKGACTADCGANITLIGYFCIPLLSDISNSSAARTLSSGFQKVGININKGWKEILIICSIGLAISIIFTLMLRFLAPIMVWTTVLIIAIGSIAATITLWVLWRTKSDKADCFRLSEHTRMADETDSYAKTLLYSAIGVTILTIIILIVLIALRKRIQMVIALFIEAGKVLAAIPLLLFQPLLTMVLMVALLVVWLIGLLMILSAGDPKLLDGGFVRFELDAVIANMRWYHLFGLYWASQFLLGCQHIAVAGAVADWYFTRDKGKLGFPIPSAIGRLVKYHLGSVALGSLILAIVSLIRTLLKHLESRLKQMTGSTCKWLCCCCQCCLWAFDSFIKFIARNAYIEVAIFGHGFCKSAQMSFMIIASNALRVAAITFVGDFLLFLVKIAIVIITVFIGIEITNANPAINNIWPVVALGGIFTYCIAFCFISVYEMTIDTLFICFCEDHQRNNGTDKPYFMSRGLMKFVENSKAALDALDKGGTGEKKAPAPMQVMAIPVQFVTPHGQFGNSPSHLQPPHMPMAMPEGDGKSGTTPLHAPYMPFSEPPSPSRCLPP